MEYEKIKQLMEDMGNSKLSSIDIDFPDGTKISMKKENKEVIKVVETVEENLPEVENVNDDIHTITTLGNKDSDFEGKIVKSPMVGTFYLKSSPTSEPYVCVGQKVSKGEVLCIVEAMKLMNEIESEFDGEIAEILVEDGEVVEYGKPLFKIK